mgnify:CR=1 FL=1
MGGIILEICESIKTKSDIELYKLFLNGNNEAFNWLIVKHRKMLTNFIMTYVKNTEIAEDIAQDSFMYMIINKVEYDFKYSFKTYLYTIAKSRALNYLKKAKKTIYVEDVISNNITLEGNVESEFIVKEKRSALIETIKKLKKEQQIVIYLYYFQGFKYKEISKILNQSMSKTKMAIHRAKKILEKFMKEDNNYDEWWSIC